MPADPDPITPDEQLVLDVAHALARLDYALDHGLPWLTAQQLDVTDAALAILVEAEYVRRRTTGEQRRYRITGPGSDFLAAVRDEAVQHLAPGWLAARRDAGTAS